MYGNKLMPTWWVIAGVAIVGVLYLGATGLVAVNFLDARGSEVTINLVIGIVSPYAIPLGAACLLSLVSIVLWPDDVMGV